MMSKSTVAKNAAAIADLKNQIQELKETFEKSLVALESKIESLLLSEKNTTSSTVSTYTEIDTSISENEITEHDVLIIGDSLVASVDPEIIDPDADISVECVRGGRPIDISERFEQISKNKIFKRIIVHVGTNLIPRFSPNYVADQILLCLERIKSISPSSKVTYSTILPKTGPTFLPGINLINNLVDSAGKTGPSRYRFSTLCHRENFSRTPLRLVDSSLFNPDQLHLSLDGKLAFNLGLNFFIGNN